jgi:excisionase family DNA binding protein
MRISDLGGQEATEAPRFYSVAQVAQMFGMSTMTLYRAIAAGEFPAVRIRGRLIVPAKALERLTEEALSGTIVGAPIDLPAGNLVGGGR